MTFEQAPSRARRMISKHDTIISTVITYFPEADNNLICSTGFAVITPGERLDPRYLYFWVSSHQFISEIVARSVG